MTITRDIMVAELRKGGPSWNAFRDSNAEEVRCWLSVMVPNEYRYLDTELSNINLESANLQELNFREVNLEGANLKRTNFEGADLKNANLRGADLRNANFMNARLLGADFRGAYISGANFSRADMRNADFRGAHEGGIGPEFLVRKAEKAKQIADANNRVFAARASAAIASVDGHLSGRAGGGWVDAADALDKLLKRPR